MKPNREPWLAAMIGLAFPGAGHFYAGAPRMGFLLMAVGAVTVVVACWSFLAPVGSIPLAFAATILNLALVAGSSFDAHRVVCQNASAEFEATRRAQKDAWKAVAFSMILPGTGQFYAGRIWSGIAFLAGILVGGWLGAWGVLVHIGVSAAAMLDAWRGDGQRHDIPIERGRKIVLAIALFPMLVLLIPVAIRARLVKPYRTPSSSMSPTLVVGDYFFVDRTRYGRADAGDVVVFRNPQNPRQEWVKRVVAAGGQKVGVRNKQVFVDGVPVEEPYVRHRDSKVLPGEESPRDNMPEIQVPLGHYFVLGDDRDDSNDSRFLGPVAGEAVLGRVYKIYWPLDRAGPLRTE